MLTHSNIARTFGFQLHDGQELESIYAYAPVYRLGNAAGDWILKRTQKPLARGRAVAAWEHSLAARGIRVVTPAAGFGENPRAFDTGEAEGEVWVVYPFIAGSVYLGDAAQLEAAGELLGSIHAAGAGEDLGLKIQETITAVPAEDVEQDSAVVLQHVDAFFPESGAQARAILAERAQTYFQRSLPAALEARLPLAVCSWDYKASNLIYQGGSSPVLVDADNAARIPRLYDLAIAALLFHNEGRGPCRLFTPAEWAAFLAGYLRHVQFTPLEREIWPDLLLCAWMDEALWLLQDDEPGWADPQQSQLLLSLLVTDLSGFALPD